MDQTLVDLTDAPENLETGEKVTLIGKQQNEEILLTQLSEDAESIPWELLCSITKRVPRVYTTIGNSLEAIKNQSWIESPRPHPSVL